MISTDFSLSFDKLRKARFKLLVLGLVGIFFVLLLLKMAAIFLHILLHND
jgi:hypothetical protein